MAPLTLIKPSYVNRPVTLKMEPRDEWMGGVVWKFLQPGSAEFRVANNQNDIPQNSVIVGPQFGDFFKTKCVYADTGIDIFCRTDFGIKPLNISIKVGRQFLPLVVEEFGTGPTIRDPSCFYGDNLTATCEVNDALPVPMIEIRLDEKKLKVQQHDEYERFKNTFSSKTTLTTVDKEWNGTEMCCTSKIGNNMNGRYAEKRWNITVRSLLAANYLWKFDIYWYINNNPCLLFTKETSTKR
ncbi:hypothetical protein MAR_021589 [Mya arenaria]|uniref:Uncharacterized protein n=1 Tax=Mya arenaria TaxID=6604 RepID=A0ABY7EB55_MYAAR|nr:hypothetical protein MAR_021589 [Mya arenaria]